MCAVKHDLDYAEIDDLDEISGDEQLALIWCGTHQKYEWHYRGSPDPGPGSSSEIASMIQADQPASSGFDLVSGRRQTHRPTHMDCKR
jgi:hypothetical protein